MANSVVLATLNYLNQKVSRTDLASVAFSGSYNDLTNKPSIPTKVSDLTNDSQFVTQTDLSSLLTPIEGNVAQLRADLTTLDGVAVKVSGNQTIAGDKTFSGNVMGVTAAEGDNSTKLATTAFVQNAIGDAKVQWAYDAVESNMTLTGIEASE